MGVSLPAPYRGDSLHFAHIHINQDNSTKAIISHATALSVALHDG
jgi:hypothetical protein